MRAALTVSILALLMTPASADWQYAKWGMTAQQVLAASKGEARSIPSGSRIVCASTDQRPIGYVPSKRIDTWTFEVVFCSGDNGRLSSVALEPKPSDNSFLPLKTALQSRYGRPIQESTSDIGWTVWRDERGGNLVRLSRVISSGRIEYRAIAKGL